MLFLINNWTVPSSAATSPSTYVITLTVAAYERFSEDEDIVSAISAKNEALAAKNYTLNLVSA